LERLPELIAENLLLAALFVGVLGLLIGVLLGRVFRSRDKSDD
jgi:ABC-type lipoprotein release transport system permease subunit